jgi:hypothetical protein
MEFVVENNHVLKKLVRQDHATPIKSAKGSLKNVKIIGWEDWVLEFLFDTLDIIWVIKVIIYFQSLKWHFNGGFMSRFSRPRLS